MRFIYIIIAIFGFFSIGNTNAYTITNSPIANTLNLKHAPTTIELNMKKIIPRAFKDPTLQNVFYTWQDLDTIVRKNIRAAAQDGSLDVYRVNGLVKKYTTFVDYTNNIFYYLGEIDRNPKLENDRDIQYALLENYKMASTYYADIQYTLANALKR